MQRAGRIAGGCGLACRRGLTPMSRCPESRPGPNATGPSHLVKHDGPWSNRHQQEVPGSRGPPTGDGARPTTARPVGTSGRSVGSWMRGTPGRPASRRRSGRRQAGGRNGPRVAPQQAERVPGWRRVATNGSGCNGGSIPPRRRNPAQPDAAAAEAPQWGREEEEGRGRGHLLGW